MFSIPFCAGTLFLVLFVSLVGCLQAFQMKRMEVPRLPLHNLQVARSFSDAIASPYAMQGMTDDLLRKLMQGNSGTLSTEAKKQSRPAPVVQQEEPASDITENQTPPSRILRSGKRVPLGTATKVPPRTASKAARVAAPTSDDVPITQVYPDSITHT